MSHICAPRAWLQHTATHCNTLQHTAAHCNTLQHTATNCNTPEHKHTPTPEPNYVTHLHALCLAAIYCNTLQHTATHCNTLQHTATHRNTLQHNATQCNTNIHLHLSETMWHICTHRAWMQHSKTHCNTLQHTATHCNTQQRTATQTYTHTWAKLCHISARTVHDLPPSPISLLPHLCAVLGRLGRPPPPLSPMGKKVFSEMCERSVRGDPSLAHSPPPPFCELKPPPRGEVVWSDGEIPVMQHMSVMNYKSQCMRQELCES